MDTEDTEPNPFNNRRFIASAVVVTLIVMLGVVIGVTNMVRGSSEAAPSPSPSNGTTSQPTASGEASICNLAGEVLTGSLWREPRATWDYQGTTAYPKSKTYGPARTTAKGVRYCFQHSPEGALFAAANAAVQASDPETIKFWGDYFIAKGPHRDAVLSEGAGSGTSDQGVRIKIAGFRLLAYDGQTARADIGLQGSVSGQTVHLSMVYDLVWEEGDWKLNISDPAEPINVANVPDLSGYIPWEA